METLSPSLNHSFWVTILSHFLISGRSLFEQVTWLNTLDQHRGERCFIISSNCVALIWKCLLGLHLLIQLCSAPPCGLSLTSQSLCLCLAFPGVGRSMKASCCWCLCFSATLFSTSTWKAGKRTNPYGPLPMVQTLGEVQLSHHTSHLNLTTALWDDH